MRQIFTFLCVLLFLFQCRSRDFQTVTIQDKTLTSAKSEDKQKIEKAREFVSLGNNEFQKGNFDQALEKAKQSLAEYELVDGYALLGATEYQLGEYNVSKEAYQRGLDLEPQNEKLLIGLGTVLATQGENQDALSAYETLQKLKPEELVYQYKVGILLKSLGRFSESLVTFQALDGKENFAYPVELLNQLGDVSLELKKYAEAEAYFARAEALNPNVKATKDAKNATRIASFVEKGNNYLNKKLYNEAIQEFQKAISLQNNNGVLWSFLGNAQLLKGSYQESEKSFKQSQTLSPNNPSAYLGLCNLYIKTHEYNECLKVSKLGLQKIPKNAEIRNKQGICEWKWGETKKAILSFGDASTWDPNFFEPKLNLAYILIDTQRFSEAVEVLTKAEAHPKANLPEIKKAKILAESQKFIAAGDNFLRQGKQKFALESYGKALGVSPENPSAHNAYGRAYFAFSEYKKSEDAYLVAYRLDSDNPGTLQGLARVYAKTGNSKKEKEFLKKLETLSTTDPFSAITLGRIAEDSSKWDEAESIYLSLKKKYPNFEAVDFRLGTLYFKRAVEENGKENYKKASDWIQKSKKYTSDIPEVTETEKTISENARFAEILPLVIEGNSLFNKRKYLEAIVPYEKAYKQVPKESLLVKIAECYIEKGEEEKGITVLENAVKSNKENATSFKEGIAAFYYKKDELKKSEEGFREILAEKPDAYYSYYMLGLISLKRKNYDTAISELDKSILVNGNFPAANVAKGLTYYRMNQADLAKKEFEKAREKDTQFGLSSYNLAIAYFNEDLNTEAKNLLLSIRKNDPDFLDGEIHLAYIYFKENKLEEAEKTLNAVIQEEPSAEALFGLFRVLDAKQKQTPSEKNKAKRNSLKTRILKEYSETKYAKLLPSDDLDDAPLHVTDLNLTGTPISIPLVYPNRILVNYGSAISAYDRITKELVWKQYTNPTLHTLVAGKDLIGISTNSIVRIAPESGKILFRKNWDSGFIIQKAIPQKDQFLVVIQNKKSGTRKLVKLSWDLEAQEDLSTDYVVDLGLFPSGKLLVLFEENKLQKAKVYPNIPPNSSNTILVPLNAKSAKQKVLLLGCWDDSCLVDVEGGLFSIYESGKWVSLLSDSNIISTIKNDEGLFLKTRTSFFRWKGGNSLKELTQSNSEFVYPMDSLYVEGSTKVLVRGEGKNRVSVPWRGDRDGQTISTITVD